jgi:class 3 adenylate cyclase
VVLLSETTRKQLPEAVGMRELGTLKLKGRAEEVRVFAPGTQ